MIRCFLSLLFFTSVIDSSFGAPVAKENEREKLNRPEKSTNGLYDPKAFYSLDKFEGDILGSYPTTNKSGASSYHAIAEAGYLWPNGEVVYSVDSSLQNLRPLIKQAMDHITQMTGGCIKFRERTSESDYVYMYQSQGCYSQVGRQGGTQELSLGRGCHVPGVVIHELLHALGFFHHHSRSDRDRYLRINYQNIDPQAYPQFQKLNEWENQLFTEFDYSSIMIYGATAFSRDGYSQTMTPINPMGSIIRDPGYKYSMTQSDVASLKKLYKCDSGNPFDNKKIGIIGSIWPQDQTTTTVPDSDDDSGDVTTNKPPSIPDISTSSTTTSTMKPPSIVEITSTMQPTVSWTTQPIVEPKGTTDYSTIEPIVSTIFPAVVPSIPSIPELSTLQPNELVTDSINLVTITSQGKIITPPSPVSMLPEPEQPSPVPPLPAAEEKNVLANEISQNPVNGGKKETDKRKYSY